MIESYADADGFHMLDTTTGERRSFTDRAEFNHATLVEILRHAEEVDQGLQRLESLYEHRRPMEARP